MNFTSLQGPVERKGKHYAKDAYEKKVELIFEEQDLRFLIKNPQTLHCLQGVWNESTQHTRAQHTGTLGTRSSV